MSNNTQDSTPTGDIEEYHLVFTKPPWPILLWLGCILPGLAVMALVDEGVLPLWLLFVCLGVWALGGVWATLAAYGPSRSQ